jgi:nucleotide-binding universal stress UspA family protein
MQGTMLCGVTDSDEGRHALAMAAKLSERLGLRLVLAHVAEGIGPVGNNGDGAESVSMKGSCERAARVVARLATEHRVDESVGQRSAVGDPAALIGQIAAEEAADVIVIGARGRGRFRRVVESRFAEQLENETPVPVLIAPLQARAQKVAATARGQR